MLIVDRAECIVADATTRGGIIGLAGRKVSIIELYFLQLWRTILVHASAFVIAAPSGHVVNPSIAM